MCQIMVRLWRSKIWIVMSNFALICTFRGCACCCLLLLVVAVVAFHIVLCCALSLLACTAALVRMCSYQGIWSRRPSLHMHLVSKPRKATVLFLCRDGEKHHCHFCPRGGCATGGKTPDKVRQPCFTFSQTACLCVRYVCKVKRLRTSMKDSWDIQSVPCMLRWRFWVYFWDWLFVFHMVWSLFEV